MAEKEPASSPRRDYAFIAIVALVLLNAAWLLLMPVVPAIASTTLHRFHLRSRSFPLWAIQQPIPAMYNFGNRFEVRKVPPDFISPGFLEPIIDTNRKRYINHFPTRIFTFANTRYRYLADGQDRWLIIDSTYRGQSIETTIHAKPREDGGYDMIFLPTKDGK